MLPQTIIPHLYLVLVVEILVTQVSYEPDELGLESHDRRRWRISNGGEVLHRTENIFSGLADSVHLLQNLCGQNQI